MVVVSHLSLFLGDKFRGRCDSRESHLPLFKTIYFPIAPWLIYLIVIFVIVCLQTGNYGVTTGFPSLSSNTVKPAAFPSL